MSFIKYILSDYTILLLILIKIFCVVRICFYYNLHTILNSHLNFVLANIE